MQSTPVTIFLAEFAALMALFLLGGCIASLAEKWAEWKERETSDRKL
jgi:hypothetical protein